MRRNIKTNLCVFDARDESREGSRTGRLKLWEDLAKQGVERRGRAVLHFLRLCKFSSRANIWGKPRCNSPEAADGANVWYHSMSCKVHAAAIQMGSHRGTLGTGHMGFFFSDALAAAGPINGPPLRSTRRTSPRWQFARQRLSRCKRVIFYFDCYEKLFFTNGP
jgi:hypothetical protein